MSRAYALLFYAGAGALALVMLTDALAVVGRHLGMPLLGAIEIIQAAILATASTAMVAATLAGTHARVRLLLDRLSPPAQRALTRINGALTSAFFLALTAGSVWIAWDLWGAHEESDVLRLSYRPLRILAIVATATLAILFLRQALLGREPGPDRARDHGRTTRAPGSS